MNHQSKATSLPDHTINKYEVVSELTLCGDSFNLTHRDLTVLQALLSFVKGAQLSAGSDYLVVHPSNKTICDRLNGMPCSTMRRHLAKLVASGLVARRDSPNGKRYARRFAGEKITYGFDLSPLLHRYDDICDRAETARAAQEEHRRQRETVSLMRRDLASLADYGAELRPELSIWDQFADMARLTARALRRKLPLIELTAMAAKLKDALDQLRNILDPQESVEQPTVQTPKMSTNQPQNEQHHQNSKKDSYESEEPPVEENYASKNTHINKEEQKLPNIPLSLVLEACSEIQTYSQTKIRHWHEFVQLGDHMHRMMGVPHHVWDLAKRIMGPEQAASVLASILERFTEIQNHGGYLRALCNKAERGEFSCGPMIMALLRKTG